MRVPPSGQGYAGGTVPAQSELAGFYAQVSGDPKPGNNVQQRANIPTWSTLAFSENGQTFSVPGPGVSSWRQSLDLHTGIVTTSARWTPPDGHVTDLTYQVLTDRAGQFVGLVSLQFTPQWTGVATVTDAIDGTADTTATPELTTQVSKGWDVASRQDWVTIAAKGTNIQTTEASQLQVRPNVLATTTQTDQTTDQSVGQVLGFSVTAGQTYTITKYVGVESSQDTTSDTVTTARSQASSAASTGWDALLQANKAAWADLWKGWIEIRGNRTLATDVNASQFYLWSSTRAGVDWSISPAGLSSNGYDGHIFWDAETWMYPSLLAQHPDLAAGMNAYRFQRLSAAELHATATGWAGARFPWESALDGTEQIPPPVSVNSEGLYEQHITADIALAQWQYYLATGDKTWLSAQGWPVLSQAATFWASRAKLGADGSYHIDGVTGPDEENPNVNDEVYTNVGAMRTLEDAVQAAHVLGIAAPGNWSTIAAKLVMLRRGGMNPEFSGYRNQLVKQADVTLLQLPMGLSGLARRELERHQLLRPAQRPRRPVDERRGEPDRQRRAEHAGMRELRVRRAQLPAVHQGRVPPVLRDPHGWRVHVHDRDRRVLAGIPVRLLGDALESRQRWPEPEPEQPDRRDRAPRCPVARANVHGGDRSAAHHGQPQRRSADAGADAVRRARRGPGPPPDPGHPAPRPDRHQGSGPLRRRRRLELASGSPALAAVDGSTATDWQPSKLHATLTARLAPLAGRIGTITVRWGHLWPTPPAPNVPPPPGPVTVLRPRTYQVQVSTNGRSWRAVAVIRRRSGAVDIVHLKAVSARFVRIRATGVNAKTLPMLQELTVTS